MSSMIEIYFPLLLFKILPVDSNGIKVKIMLRCSIVTRKCSGNLYSESLTDFLTFLFGGAVEFDFEKYIR